MDDDERHIRSLGGENVLTPSDLPSLSSAARRVETLLRDRRWHTATEILRVSGQREGLRRMRELRTRYQIDQQRIGDSREFEYRLIMPADGQQGRLFAATPTPRWERD